MQKIRFPSDTERHAIYGQTGSGKTVFGLWCLSRRSYHKMPWIILDTKGDPTIAKIPRLEEIDISAKVPKAAGLYVVRPTIDDFDDGVATDWLYEVWKRERTGIFIDETTQFKPMDRGLRAILTQGRSKRIPVIMLSQQPAWVSRWMHSESEYKSYFYLDMPADIDRVRETMPDYNPLALGPHESYWRSTPQRLVVKFGACPGEAEILETFDSRLPPKPWWSGWMRNAAA
jgi:hypothetical protein